MALALHDVQTCEVNSRPEQLEPEDEFICVLQDAVPNPHIFMDHFPLDLFPALARCPAIVAFGLDLVFVFSKWLLALDRVSPLMKPVSFVEIFIGFYLDCGVEMPVAGRDARSNRVWHSVSSGAATDLMGRTLGSKVEVFRVLFQLVLDAFTLQLETVQVCRPSCGILKRLPGLMFPWSADTERRVHLHIGGFTSSRPIRLARDLARAWP